MQSSARKRLVTGRDFEADVDFTIAEYEMRGWGKIRRNHVPTKFIKNQRTAIGGAHVDRTGWLRVEYTVEGRWRGSKSGLVVAPLAFDAKVLSEGHATYHHEVKKQHQLHDLKAAAEAGEFAFLLIYARDAEAVFVVPILPHFSALLSPRGVKLWEWFEEHRRPLLPSIPKKAGSIGCDFLPLLPHCDPTKAK